VGVQDPAQGVPHGLRRPGSGVRGARQCLQVQCLCGTQLQRSRHCLEHLIGHLRAAALLQAHVVVHAHAGQRRELFATKTRDASVAGRLVDTNVLRAHPGPSRLQEGVQL
jgi:hypothetical protein